MIPSLDEWIVVEEDIFISGFLEQVGVLIHPSTRHVPPLFLFGSSTYSISASFERDCMQKVGEYATKYKLPSAHLQTHLFGGNTPVVQQRTLQFRPLQVLQDVGVVPEVLSKLEELKLNPIEELVREKIKIPVFALTKELKVDIRGNFSYSLHEKILPERLKHDMTYYRFIL